MQNILGDMKNVIIYLDDILIFADTIEEHDRILNEVLRRLAALNFKINKKKSRLRQTSVSFLGFTISLEVHTHNHKRTLSLVRRTFCAYLLYFYLFQQ